MKTSQRPPKGKKFYTVEQANAMLPLLTRILRDITELMQDLHQRYERIAHLQHSGSSTEAHSEETRTLVAEFERDQERMHEFEAELKQLDVELKDHFTGLIDFPCWQDDREIYLCWRLGEPAVAHWHELDSGFAGRQRLNQAKSR